jgi:hypothetical protein
LSPSEVKALSQATEVVITDDNQTAYWTNTQQLIASDVTSDNGILPRNGTNFLKIVNGTITTNGAIWHTYSSTDFSGYDYLIFSMYGTATGRAITIRMIAPDWSNMFAYNVTNDFSGWKEILIPLGMFTKTGLGSFKTVVQLYIATGAAASSNDILYFDNFRWGTYSRTALYPSQDSLGFTNTQTTVKDLQWFVRNPTSTVEVAPLVIADDNQASYWAVWNGSGVQTVSDSTTQVHDGVNSFKTIFPAYGNNVFYKDFGSNQNWSTYDIFCFSMYGSNSGNVFGIEIDCPDASNKYSTFITDNWSGWKRVTLLITALTVTGSPNLATTRKIQFYSYTVTSQTTLYFDRWFADVCPSIPVKKLTIQDLYVSNQLEESPVATDVLEVIDDGQAAFWSVNLMPALTDETTIKVKGVNSGKITIDAAYSSGNSDFAHTFGSNQDWSAYDFLSFYWYGANTGHTIQILVKAVDWSNYASWTFTDNFTGWKRIVLSLRNWTVGAGTPSLSTVKTILFYPYLMSQPQTWYIDRMVLQKGRWAFVEVAVPDTLYQYQNYLTRDVTQLDLLEWVISTYNGVYGTANNFGTTGSSCFNSRWNYTLDGSIFKTMYGESQDWISANCATFFIGGQKGETKTRKSTYMANQSITYNGVGGCKRRIGFAIKMPPYDGTASPTTGINQVKLKLEVYVPSTN